MQYIDIYELKKQLNIEDTFTDDDDYLNQLCLVSSLAVYNYCNDGLTLYTGTTEGYSGVTLQSIPVTVKHATLLLASHFYLNRQPVAFISANEIPLGFKFLLDYYKNFLAV